MKVNSLTGKKLKSISLPAQFKESVRKDLIKRAYNAARTNELQPKGVSPKAGMRHAVELKKRRNVYKSVYGRGRSRTPRKVMAHPGGLRFHLQAAQAPFTVGGRVAHPPEARKKIKEKINKKERRKALRSAISACNPIILEDKIEGLKKTKDFVKALENNDINFLPKKRLTKGVARLRGRGRHYNKGPLVVVSDKCELSKRGINIPGVDITLVNELNVKLLAPGSNPGRTVIWSEGAIKRLSEEGLFL